MISTPQLQRMRKDAVLVNTCRGPVVDEPALVAALQVCGAMSPWGNARLTTQQQSGTSAPATSTAAATTERYHRHHCPTAAAASDRAACSPELIGLLRTAGGRDRRGGDGCDNARADRSRQVIAEPIAARCFQNRDRGSRLFVANHRSCRQPAAMSPERARHSARRRESATPSSFSMPFSSSSLPCSCLLSALSPPFRCLSPRFHGAAALLSLLPCGESGRPSCRATRPSGGCASRSSASGRPSGWRAAGRSCRSSHRPRARMVRSGWTRRLGWCQRAKPRPRSRPPPGYRRLERLGGWRVCSKSRCCI